ncbi:MAG TPA: DinB family protein [Vicinamibacterales bacterium]
MRCGTFVLAAAALLVVAQPAAAQTRDGVMGDLLKDVAQVEQKIIGLAKAMPESGLAWRPMEGVRSTSEVLLHVASDNYFIPAMLDIAPPAETGITKDFPSVEKFEKRTMTREQAVAELEKSFAFLKKSMSETPDAKLDTPVTVFGMKSTMRGMWIMATTHLHEHLGQLIAYARSNKVTPPWSK